MIRYKISKNMRVLFVGINPHPGSFSRGVPFSNNKMFWYLLSRSGVIKESVDQLRDDKELRHVYNTRFNQVYRFGFLNLVNRPTRVVSELQRGEEKNGKRKILKTIREHRPATVCFVGKVTYEKFSHVKKFRFGWQCDIYASKSFVMHFPLRGKAIVRIKDLKRIMKQFKTH
ncbi:MAG TPA: mismatch-specific DNA-glycosylase [Candidatus Nitrosotalea sp.]|nr:mismatch-specific DNA-glycosylase [Candidatus Nitrosotalea sp.]